MFKGSLQSKRLLLRPLVPEDDALLYRYVTENREWLKPWEPARTPYYYTQEAQRRLLFQMEESWENGTGCVLGVFELGRLDELLGRVSVFGIVRGVWQNAFVGYSIAQSHSGKGYMTEALKRTVHYCFFDLDLHRVQLSILPRNLGSLRVAQKCAFRNEGLAVRYMEVNQVWEDHQILALTQEEVNQQYFNS